MLPVQEFISQFKDIEDANYFLMSKLGLRITKEVLTHAPDHEGDRYIDLVYLYNSDPFRTPADSTTSISANSLILDKEANIVSMSLPKIFDGDDPLAPKIDWETAILTRQYNGTKIVVYNWNDSWFIQTGESATASNAYDKHTTWYQVISNHLRNKFKIDDWTIPFQRYMDKYCYVFSYIPAGNDGAIALPENDPAIVLLAIFDKFARREMPRPVEFTFEAGFRRAEFCEVDSLEEARMYISNKNCRGVVIRDQYNTMIKLTNPVYNMIRSIADISGKVSMVGFARAILERNRDDAEFFFPECKRMFSLINFTLSEMFNELHALWYQLKDVKGQEFAAIAKNHPLKSILYRLRMGRITKLETGLNFVKPEVLAQALENRNRSEFVEELQKINRLRGKV